ncbi:MAG: radical SAM protein [Alphaproteobacteria bacterium]|jgi:hypothetical protein
MGCLNAGSGFTHWFGNIHLSGPCNRSCYFCIGQHMMELDPLNNIGVWPLENIMGFMQQCRKHGVGEINLTGSNTDPMLYAHHAPLVSYLRMMIPGVVLGIRSNGVSTLARIDDWRLYDKASISVTSTDPDIYRKTMGQGSPPDVAAIVRASVGMDIKANVVLCPETVGKDLDRTLRTLADCGITRINLREPYGQPHVGNPYADQPVERFVLGMPSYVRHGVVVTYWDVHYCHVESVNLYANGRVSIEYPITKGHSESGVVLGQENFQASGRVRDQWVGISVGSNTKGGG